MVNQRRKHHRVGIDNAPDIRDTTPRLRHRSSRHYQASYRTPPCRLVSDGLWRSVHRRRDMLRANGSSAVPERRLFPSARRLCGSPGMRLSPQSAGTTTSKLAPTAAVAHIDLMKYNMHYAYPASARCSRSPPGPMESSKEWRPTSPVSCAG